MVIDLSEAIEALADAWASLDGEDAGKDGDDEDGTYEAYLSDAKELIMRLRRRGFLVVRSSRV
jgi:hypothetical protein